MALLGTLATGGIACGGGRGPAQPSTPAPDAASASFTVDWVAGPTNLSLATRLRADGTAVWFASISGKNYETPFESKGRPER